MYASNASTAAPPTNDIFTVVQGGPAELSLFSQFTVNVEEASLRIDWLQNLNLIDSLNFFWSALDWGVPGEIVGATVDNSSTWANNVVPTITASTVSFINTTDTNVSTGDFMIINLDVRHDVPEPGTLALFGLGLVGLGLARRKRTA